MVEPMAPRQQRSRKSSRETLPPTPLPSLMNIETVAELAELLKPAIGKESSSLRLDAAAVEHITTPGLQLLLALSKSITAQGGALSITRATRTFSASLQDAGLLHCLTLEGDSHA